MHLDYSLDSVEDRKKLVEQVLQKETNPNLEQLANYLIMCMEKQERKERKILTDNRRSTINKNETSFEGLADKLGSKNPDINRAESSKSFILSQMARSDKNQLLHPKKAITKKDYADFAELRQIKDAINLVSAQKKKTSGFQAYLCKKASIDLYKELYSVKKQLVPPVTLSCSMQTHFPTVLEGFSFQDPNVIEAILCNYSILRENSWDRLTSDLWAIMMSFDELIGKALLHNSCFETIVIMKIDGCSNAEIREALRKNFNKTYTEEYISTLWRKKIPKYIADFARREHDLWLFTYFRRGQWKRCSCCGQNKLANSDYFSKNKTSKDGLYSICKECRNNKRRGV